VTQAFALPHGSGTSRDIPSVARSSSQVVEESADPALPSSPKPKRRDREDTIKRERQAVVIVDRNLLFRAGLVHALSRDSFQVFAERSSIDEVPFGDLAAGHPILLLMGLDTARIGALQVALLNLRRLYDDLHIVIFYDHDPLYPLPPEISDIGRLADALLPKDEIDSDALTKAVDLVLLGAWVVSKELLRLMASTNGHGTLESALVTAEPEADALPEPLNISPRSLQVHNIDALTERERLTDRERLVLSHLMKGASNKAIAREVGITESTVKIHVRNVMLKIDAKNRTQAAMWGYKYLV
jgi:two-component system nitrate/nitrite response regulator NarL